MRHASHIVILFVLVGIGLFHLPVSMAKETLPSYWHLPIPLQGPAPASLVTPGVSLEANDCGLCHPHQFQQWRESFHAKAAGPGLLGQLSLFDEEITRSCLNCHAPRSEQQSRLLEDQQASVHGVDCATCHVRAHRHFGPRSIAMTPHGTVEAEPIFMQSTFCAPCHQFGDDAIAVNGKPLENTFEEWKAGPYAKKDMTCQSCHMQDGSHRFAGIHNPEMVRVALSVRAKRTKTGIAVVMHNRGAGHSLPTYITPRIRILWRGDNDQKQMGQKQILTVLQRRMQWDEHNGWQELFDTRLQAGEKREVKYKLDTNDAGWVEVWVDPDADYYERIYPLILKAMSEDSAGPEAIRQIKKAQSAAKLSPYRLMRFRCKAKVKQRCL
jgi:hypothetical protein